MVIYQLIQVPRVKIDRNETVLSSRWNVDTGGDVEAVIVDDRLFTLWPPQPPEMTDND